MKKNIHPAYEPFTLVMTNGTEFMTRSASAKKKLHLEADIFSHPAWVGGWTQINTKARNVSKFNKKFAGFGGVLASSTPPEEPTETA